MNNFYDSEPIGSKILDEISAAHSRTHRSTPLLLKLGRESKPLDHTKINKDFDSFNTWWKNEK